MKLWEKDSKTEDSVMKFTVGNDRDYDRLLAPYDIVGSMAQAIMLAETGIIETVEAKQLVSELAAYFPTVMDASFSLNPEDEDIHSHLENYLVKRTGDAGKKIHTARSRNDQVMTAMQLLMKEEWRLLISEVSSLFDVLISQAENHKASLIPGYTHTQVAMPSSIALWLGAYAESLVNDLQLASGIIRVIDQNPLGSAAGYGSSFPINRELTTKLAGFSDILVSSASAQLNRSRMEAFMAQGLASLAQTLNRLAADMILFMGQDHNFIGFPEELTTGSSIMPHKKNPDVLELIRAHSNLVMLAPTQLNALTSNMISGYHRDFQLAKEILVPAIDKTKQCLAMMELMVGQMKVNNDILKAEKYKYIFSVEEVNSRVIEGKTFRDAYREVAEDIKNGTYNPDYKANYTHLGSIGNPGLDHIRKKMQQVLKQTEITSLETVFEGLSGYYSGN